MLPVGKGKGQIWLHGKFLCEADYEITGPIAFASGSQVQRVTYVVPDEHCASLLETYHLVLVLDDKTSCPMPRPVLRRPQGDYEFFLEV